jgi:hypothetical protein
MVKYGNACPDRRHNRLKQADLIFVSQVFVVLVDQKAKKGEVTFGG